MPDPRVAYCLFCDDIRHEVGGKTSLIGIYHGDMIFPFDKPVLYPKFAAFISIISDPNDNPKFIKINVIDPGKNTILNFDITPEKNTTIAPDAQKSVINIQLQFPPLQLTQEGYIEAWVETEREKMRAGRLSVKFKPAKPPKPKRKRRSES